MAAGADSRLSRSWFQKSLPPAYLKAVFFRLYMVLNGALNLRRDGAVWEKSATSSQAPACTGAATVRCRGGEEHCRGHEHQGVRQTGCPSRPHGAGRGKPGAQRPARPVSRGDCRRNSSEVLTCFSLRVRGNNARKSQACPPKPFLLELRAQGVRGAPDFSGTRQQESRLNSFNYQLRKCLCQDNSLWQNW